MPTLAPHLRYEVLTRPVLPTPPAANTLAMWQVERLPYIVQPTGNAYASAGMTMADVREILAEPPPPASQVTVSEFQDTVLPGSYYQVPYHAVIFGTVAVRFNGLNQEHTYVDKYLALDVYPYPQPRNNAYALGTLPVGPIFPVPFVPSVAVPASIMPEVPWAALTGAFLKNYAAIIEAAGEARVSKAIDLTQDKFGWRDYSIRPGFYPFSVASYYNEGTARSIIFPITIPPVVGPSSGWFQEWKPQFQKAHQVAQQAVLQAFASNIRPIPFVPAVVTGLPWWQQEVIQQWTAGRFDWERLYTGSVSNIKPIPFVPPPIVPQFCPQIPNPDGDTVVSTFGGSKQPLQVLLCRICNSGRPLLVRGDYAIWCQDCCAFVSKQDTVMMTVRAPGQLKGVF